MNQSEDENTIEYWKSKFVELNKEYDEYRTNSDALEKELDSQLQQYENRIRDLESANNRLKIDNETITSKLNELNTNTHREISQLQEELTTTNGVKDAMQKYITEIEQKNDHLENDLRRAEFSVEEFEAQLTAALERNVMLEIQLDNKNELAETVQRLRDEARELKQELAVRQKKEFSFQMSPMSKSTASTPLLQQQQELHEHEQQQQQSEHAVPHHVHAASAASGDSINTTATFLNTTVQKTTKQEHLLKPSARIAALNYIGDLLSKVTSVESKLLTSKNMVIREPPKDRRTLSISAFSKDTMKVYKREAMIPNTP